MLSLGKEIWVSGAIARISFFSCRQISLSSSQIPMFMLHVLLDYYIGIFPKKLGENVTKHMKKCNECLGIKKPLPGSPSSATLQQLL